MTVVITSGVNAWASGGDGSGITINAPNQGTAAQLGSFFTSADEILIGTGFSTFTSALLTDILDGTFSIGYDYNDLKLPTADLDVNTNKIINLVDPTSNQDAATKFYVDTVGGGPFLPLAGGTMTGNIDMAGNNLTLDVDTNTFFEAAVNDVVNLWIGGVIGFTFNATDFDVVTKSIINVVDPVLAQDAATKNYVDTEIVALSLNGTGPYLRLSGVDVMVGALDMGTNLINNVVDPTTAQQAATKNYVDTEIVALALGGTGPFLQLAGGTMTGNLDMAGNNLTLDVDTNTFFEAVVNDVVNLWIGGVIGFTFDATDFDVATKSIINVVDPVLAQDAATKNYVDTEIIALSLNGTGPYLRLSGVDTMTGALDMGTNLINNVVDPTSAQDAATKNYVDTQLLVVTPLSLSDADSDTTVEVEKTADDDTIRLSTGDAPVGYGAVVDIMTLASSGLAISMGTADTIATAGAPISMTAGTGNTTGSGGDITLTAGKAGTVANDGGAITVNGSSNSSGGAVSIVGGNAAGASGDNGGDVLITPGAKDGAGTDGQVVIGRLGSAAAPVIISSSDPDTGVFWTGANEFLIATAGIERLRVEGDGTLSVAGTASYETLVTSDDDIPNKKFVDDAITALGSGPFLPLAGGTMTGTLTTGSTVQIQADGGSAAAPSYSFSGDTDAGMWSDATNLRFAVAGTDELVVTSTEVDVRGNKVTNVATPTVGTDAVNKDFIDAQAHVRLLGSALSVDLTSTGITAILTVPTAKVHIVTNIILRARTYTPGATPTNPVVDIELASGPSFVSGATLDWGGISGAADQAVYLIPADGSPTPNAGEIIRIDVTTAAAGTFSALTVDVHVLGIEL